MSYICNRHMCKVRSATARDVRERKLVKVRRKLMDGTAIISFDVVTL